MKWSRADWLILALLAAATFALYGRTARFDFVHYDDPEYVFKNPNTLAGLTGENIRWAFTTFELANWHPLTWLSYMTDVTVFGYSASGGARAGPMHLVNALLHAGNGVLLFILLRAMTGTRWRAALVAGLFLVHPLHVESVAWISERKDVLSTFFGLLAMIAYVRYARTGSAAAYALTVLAFALSLLAKPMLVTLPFLLLVLDWWPLARTGDLKRWGRLVAEKIPLLALAAASSWITVIAQSSGGAMETMRHASLGFRLANASISYVRYLVDAIIPTRLAVLYPMSPERPLGIALLAGLVLLTITAAAVALRRRRPYLLSGWLWYLGTLVPVIGLVAVGEQARADRYTYFPLVGAFIMVVWLIPATTSRVAAARWAAVALAVLVALSIQTWRQVGVWRNSHTLFEHALSVVGPAPTILLNYGIARSEAGEHEQAIDLYRRTIEQRPNWPKTHNNMGNSFVRLERFVEAESAYRRAIEIEPRYALAYYNLGTLLARQNRLEEGERLLRESLRLNPDHAGARQNLRNALVLQGKEPE